ncbi:hypothetical protein CA54_19230 [Symmachiella macrocystis]|uniref:Uncharacterized protein n=1 Tax=Symmachiella macrocystis TaxID=2527985 RepID=A0A5C6BMY6_9PLAN|nr:hypothetical protein [Symmachiella macrocystis]TWU13097.1 hypothetical protein CA54_19230 [Symmachiella macrocystis]
MCDISDYERLCRLINMAISAIDGGEPTWRLYGSEFVESIANWQCWEGIAYFDKHAPQVVRDEAIVFLERLKEDHDFLWPGYTLGARRTDKQQERDTIAKRPLFLKMYEVLVLNNAGNAEPAAGN